jgi:hypothetical protein
MHNCVWNRDAPSSGNGKTGAETEWSRGSFLERDKKQKSQHHPPIDSLFHLINAQAHKTGTQKSQRVIWLSLQQPPRHGVGGFRGWASGHARHRIDLVIATRSHRLEHPRVGNQEARELAPSKRPSPECSQIQTLLQIGDMDKQQRIETRDRIDYCRITKPPVYCLN